MHFGLKFTESSSINYSRNNLAYYEKGASWGLDEALDVFDLFYSGT